MSTSPVSIDEPRCPQCHEPLQTDSAFCGNCGASVADVSARDDTRQTGDSQDTVTFRPLHNAPDDGFATTHDPSPWAQPGTPEYDPAQTSTTSTPPQTWTASPPPYGGTGEAVHVEMRREEGSRGIRGFFLGLLAVLLIAGVMALYLYDAWLSDSAREMVEGWLPWLD